MSVLIKGMKMPEGCGECNMRFLADPNYVCCGVTDRIPKIVAKYDNSKIDLDRRTKSIKSVKRPEWCPLVELPDHGDLIDKTDLMESLADWQLSEAPQEGIYWDSGRNVTSHELQYSIYRLLGDVYEEVRDEPVIIPAERSEASLCDNCDEQNDAGCSWCKRAERSEDD